MEQEKGAVYCRLSQDDGSAGESGSIQTQRTLLTQYCKEHSIQIVDYYCDDGWSGTNFERPEFKRMIDDIENGKINAVILNELIEKIVVHEKEIGADGVRTQQVDIYYKFIGLINQKAEGGCKGEVVKVKRTEIENQPA